MNEAPGAALPEILIVDDDAGMVQALAKALRPLGRLRFATHGQDALRRLADAAPDLVLLDAQMPGLSGFEVLDAMRCDAALADVPVIMITSHAEADVEQAGLERGAADFIAKPLHPAIVQARVRTQLRLKQANDQLRAASARDRFHLDRAQTDLRDSLERLQRTADDLRLANESLLRFVRIASHDLREPLNTIQQFVGLLAEDHAADWPGDARHYLRLVVRAGARMRTLLDDVVRYARLQRGQTDTPAEVSLDQVLAELRDALAARIVETGASLQIDPLPRVRGHASLLALLFQNLLHNALTYVPRDRSPVVRVSAEVGDGTATIRVQDNGIGIAREHMDGLFEPFQRLHRQSEYEGTGLGLALSRQVAEAHGGRIRVDSEPGHGACFVVTLPLPDGAGGVRAH